MGASIEQSRSAWTEEQAAERAASVYRNAIFLPVRNEPDRPIRTALEVGLVLVQGDRGSILADPLNHAVGVVRQELGDHADDESAFRLGLRAYRCRAALGMEQVRTECAWCGALIRDGRLANGLVSHGMCGACAEQELATVGATL